MGAFIRGAVTHGSSGSLDSGELEAAEAWLWPEQSSFSSNTKTTRSGLAFAELAPLMELSSMSMILLLPRSLSFGVTATSSLMQSECGYVNGILIRFGSLVLVAGVGKGLDVGELATRRRLCAPTKPLGASDDMAND